MKSLPLLLALVCLSLSAAPEPAITKAEEASNKIKARTIAWDRNAGKAFDHDVYGLPRVLLLCDFVTLGYADLVREKLAGRANVHRALPTRTHPPNTQIMHANSLDWLITGNFDVIHFDSGLHITNLPKAGRPIPPQPQITPQQYEMELRASVALLKQTNAKLVFATMTTAPDDADVGPFNKIALKVMRENGVAIDDLAGDVGPDIAKHLRHQNTDWKRIGTESYSKEGYAMLGQAVAKSIETSIAK
jgi:acyl-CoA thioesterase-1